MVVQHDAQGVQVGVPADFMWKKRSIRDLPVTPYHDPSDMNLSQVLQSSDPATLKNVQDVEKLRLRKAGKSVCYEESPPDSDVFFIK